MNAATIAVTPFHEEAAPEGAATRINVLLLPYPITNGRTSRSILSPLSSSTFARS